jgi:hypothetical protein
VITRRQALLSLAGGAFDFASLVPRRIPRSCAYREPGYHLWDPAMVRTTTRDGMCHLLYSRWPEALGFDAWATHAQIAWATARKPEGPYRFQKIVLPWRGGQYWDGHSVYNTCLLAHGGRYYLYYTGNHGPATWSETRSPSLKEESWWVQRNSQRVGVAVADHPGGPWKRFDGPLVDTGPETGNGIIAVPNVIARPDGKFLMVYKTLAPGPGNFGGGVVHYPALADSPLGPFRRAGGQIIDKRKLLRTGERFNFHIDDHLEWIQGGRYYGLVKDHDRPFLTPYGRSLLLVESDDGLAWRLAAKPLAKDFRIEWEDGAAEDFERLEMPKLHLENGVPKVLFLAAKNAGSSAASFLVAIPLLGGKFPA